MQLRLDLGGSPAPAPAVGLWELVRAEERRTAIVLLTALIARTVAGEEALDDLASLRDPGVSGERDE